MSCSGEADAGHIDFREPRSLWARDDFASAFPETPLSLQQASLGLAMSAGVFFFYSHCTWSSWNNWKSCEPFGLSYGCFCFQAGVGDIPDPGHFPHHIPVKDRYGSAGKMEEPLRMIFRIPCPKL